MIKTIKQVLFMIIALLYFFLVSIPISIIIYVSLEVLYFIYQIKNYFKKNQKNDKA
jgi:hypothetical protein